MSILNYLKPKNCLPNPNGPLSLQASFYEINSHEINCHEIKSHEHKLNFLMLKIT